MLKPELRLSKTKFVSGVQCHKMLWWMVHEPDAPELEPDPEQQFIFDQGNEVGRVAQSYVPGGVLIDVPHVERQRRLAATAAAMRDGAKVLYEAAFEHDDVIVVVDILQRGRRGWKLIEVKSTTRVKPAHFLDVAVQTHVLRGAGLNVERSELMHLNKECRFPDLSNLFVRANLSAEVEHLVEDVPRDIRSQMRMLRGPLPGVEIGDHCTDPYECPFMGRCWPEAPPHAIETLFRLSRAQRDDLKERGLRTIHDLTDGEDLTVIQARQLLAVREKRLIVETGLRKVLDAASPPLAFLDFETITPAIPVWDGCRPYDPVPVQLSVHRLAPTGGLSHHQWLAEGPGDPREELAQQLIRATRGARTIFTYNASFESARIRELRDHLPKLVGVLGEIDERLVDLLPIVRNHIYHPNFGGKFSLKAVAPVLVPGIAYKDLEIAEGGDARRQLFKLLLQQESLGVRERHRLRHDLMKYCALDTLALVKLYKRLRELAVTSG